MAKRARNPAGIRDIVAKELKHVQLGALAVAVLAFFPSNSEEPLPPPLPEDQPPPEPPDPAEHR